MAATRLIAGESDFVLPAGRTGSFVRAPYISACCGRTTVECPLGKNNPARLFADFANFFAEFFRRKSRENFQKQRKTMNK